MRFAPSFPVLVILAALHAAACGGGAVTNAQAPESNPTPPATSEAAASESAPPSKPARDDDGWAGEKAEKSGEKAGSEGSSPSATVHAGEDSKQVETRTMDVIRTLVMDNRKAARKCYEDARRDLKDLKGDVVIHFVLDPEGKVKSAELNRERSTLKAPSVVDCVIGVIKGIRFPKSSRGMETSTNYPFNFTP